VVVEDKFYNLIFAIFILQFREHDMEKLFFLTFAAIAVISALAVVSVRNPVHSAIALIVCLFQVAAVFILLRSPFLAAVQVFIYVGAVMVLFLFVIMMLDIKRAVITSFLPSGRFWIIALLLLLIGEIVFTLADSKLVDIQMAQASLDGTVMEIGKAMFSTYLLPFEIVSVILLVALMAAIVMGRKEIK